MNAYGGGRSVRSAAIVLFLLSLIFITGCVKITGLEGQPIEVRQTETGLTGVMRSTTDLIAMVKGSIYESGELVSVFGTCLDGDQLYIPNVTAVLNAWYPNGTNFITNSSMTEVDPGRFLYTGPMEAVRGTYLTELVCEKDGQYAYAWGEWQNPYWVARINDTQNLVNVTLQEVQENQDLINNLSLDVETGFNQTFIQINNTNTSLYNEIINVGIIANASVDRNDSYIVELLQYLLNGSGTTNPFFNSTITTVEDADIPLYRREWVVRVKAYDFQGGFLSGDDIQCFITTNNDPATTNETMVYIGTDEDEDSSVTFNPPYFKHKERIYVSRGTILTWDITCTYNI